MWAYWLAGIGTLALALITFYVEVLKPRCNRPKFTVTFENAKPYCRLTTVQKIGGGYANAHWLRLRVANSGRSVARICVGKLIRVLNQARQQIVDYDPVALHWVGTDPNAVPLKSVDLNPGEYEYLDFIYTRDDSPSDAHICRDVVERGIPRTLPPGQYILEVTIYGENVTPKPERYHLTWSASNIQDIRLEAELSTVESWKRALCRAIRSARFPIRVALWILPISITVLALGYALTTKYPLQAIFVMYTGYFGLAVAFVRFVAEPIMRIVRWWRSRRMA